MGTHTEDFIEQLNKSYEDFLLYNDLLTELVENNNLVEFKDWINSSKYLVTDKLKCYEVTKNRLINLEKYEWILELRKELNVELKFKTPDDFNTAVDWDFSDSLDNTELPDIIITNDGDSDLTGIYKD